MTINLDYWKSLDKAQQEALLKAAEKIEKAQWEASKNEDNVALKLLGDNGVKIKEPTEALKKELDMVASKMLDAYLADADESIKKIFTEFKK